MTEWKLALLVAGLGIIGFILRPWFSRTGSRDFPFSEFWRLFLAAFGTVSGLLYLAAFFHLFRWIVPAVLLPVAVSVLFRRPALSGISRYLLFLAGIAVIAVAMFRMARPFETVIASEDASIYVGSAFQLAHSGSLEYVDPLLIEMDPEERRDLTVNRFPRDMSGHQVRFPGGVPITDLSSGKVGFSFFHLFPIWLAFGITVMGAGSYLSLMSLFAVISVISLGLLARMFGGRTAAWIAPVALLCFYVQQYFIRMPLSESLAQPLFLSGLLVWSRLQQQREPVNVSDQVLAGILWGALILCRIDALYFLVVSLILMFSWIRPLRNEFLQWRFLIACLAVSGLFVAYQQTETGSYFYLLSGRPFSGTPLITDAILGSLLVVNRWIKAHSVPAQCVLLLLVATIAFVTRKPPTRDRFRQARPYIGTFLAAILLLPVLAIDAPLVGFVRRLGWFSEYLPSWTAIAFLIGLVAMLLRIPGNQRLYGSVFLLFGVPAVSLLIHPMVVSFQPTAMRRFFIMVIPIFFLLSACGYAEISDRLRNRNRSIAAVLAFVPLLAGCFYLAHQSRLLFRPLENNLSGQATRMASEVNPRSLIVIPDSLAGLHLEVPLQFIHGRNVLLLPLEYAPGKLQYSAVERYLHRRMNAGQEVIAVSAATDREVSRLKCNFRLEPAGSGTIRFERVAISRSSEFVSRFETVAVPYSFHRIGPARHPARTKLVYNDPELGFVDFHEVESGFRWSMAESLICGFSYTPGSAEISLILETGPAAPGNLPPRVFINETNEATFVKQDGRFTYYRAGKVAKSEIHAILIRSNVFSPGISDPRSLGISFVSLSFQ